MKRLPAAGQLLIGTELFTYTGVTAGSRKVTGVTREAKGTSLAAHTILDDIYFIEHEIYVYYGNADLEDPSDDDPDYDLTKPIITLTSTNVSWIYAYFLDDNQMQTGIWTPAIIQTANRIDTDNASGFYTADADTESDPAENMGMSIKAFQSGTRWKAECAYIYWNFYHPAGITHVTATGEKYRYTSRWPAAGLWKKKTSSGSRYSVWADATPTVVQTWEALAAHSAVALGAGYYYLLFRFGGTIGATANSVNYYEIDTVTLALASANVPQGTFNAEQSNYHIQATITNNTSGEWLKVCTGMPINTALTVDCLNKLAYLADNSIVQDIKFSSVRKDWLPVAVGANELQFDDAGTAGVTINIYWRDRNN